MKKTVENPKNERDVGKDKKGDVGANGTYYSQISNTVLPVGSPV